MLALLGAHAVLHISRMGVNFICKTDTEKKFVAVMTAGTDNSCDYCILGCDTM
jgi:hypothetical protein